MTKSEKINALREGVRKMGDVNDKGEQEVVLVHVQLRELDELTVVAIDDVDVLVAKGVSVLDEYDWEKPVDELSDEDINALYDAMTAHEEWVNNQH